jgi:hypothetical protein
MLPAIFELGESQIRRFSQEISGVHASLGPSVTFERRPYCFELMLHWVI